MSWGFEREREEARLSIEVQQQYQSGYQRGLAAMAPRSGTYGVQLGTDCAVHKHTGWVPLEWHHIHPLGDGGPDIQANKVRVCANAHYSIHAALDVYMRWAKTGYWDQDKLRHLSPAVKKLAWQGFQAIVSMK